MRSQVLVVVGLLAGAGVAAVAYSQGVEPGPRTPRGRRGLDPALLKQELGLNDQQVSQLQKLHMDGRKSAIRRQADTQLAQLGLRELMDSPNVDEKALQARIKELADLHAAHLRARVDAELALRKVLTPEQQEKLKQLRAERPGRLDRPRGEPRPRIERGPRGRRPGPPPGAGREPEPLTGRDAR